MMPKRSLRPLDHVVVEAVGADVGERGVPLVVHQARFLLQRVIRPADVQAAGRHREVGGQRRSRRAPGRSSTVALDSTISWIVFMPAQRPAKRLMAKACRPRSRISCTLAGKNTGRPQALKMWSLWCAAVELLATWSSPATAITPPQRDGAGQVGVLEDVGRAVHARALAVPDAEHAVELLASARGEAELLRAPHARWPPVPRSRRAGTRCSAP